jgi:hypothetical protein
VGKRDRGFNKIRVLKRDMLPVALHTYCTTRNKIRVLKRDSGTQKHAEKKLF